MTTLIPTATQEDDTDGLPARERRAALLTIAIAIALAVLGFGISGAALVACALVLR